MWSIDLSRYELTLGVLGAVMLLAAWLPRLVTSRAITFPVFYVLGGLALFQLPIGLPVPNPLRFGFLAERLTELAVIVALMGAGLKLDRPLGWRAWGVTWRLLGIAMPLTILGAAVLGWGVMGLAPAAAVLLGAVIAPTDPVMASDVQVGPPGRGDQNEVRFGLTSEAGLNDALAFPFTYMALAMAVWGASPAEWLGPWLVVDAGYRLAVGLVLGVVGGQAVARLLFVPVFGRTPLAAKVQGSFALGATFAVYGMCELLQGYGFLAVFVAACTIRRYEYRHRCHETMDTFVGDAERVLLAVLLVLLGGAAVDLLSALTLPGGVVAVLLVILVRPLSGYAALIGREESWQARMGLAFFGIRGIGSLYYLAYATNHADFEGIEEVWAAVVLTILISALVHGLSATPAMRRIEAVRKTAGPSCEPDGATR